MNRRSMAWCLMALPFVLTGSARAEEEAWAAVGAGSIVLFRHARAPGTGDPPGFQLTECATQRNLNDEGRDQARRIGQAFRDRGIAVARVLTSQWCRARDTADLAFPGQPQDEPAFNSFFQDRGTEEAQTAAALAIFTSWQGPGALVVFTHQVNITALTGITPAEGEGIVVRISNGVLQVLGRIRP